MNNDVRRRRRRRVFWRFVNSAFGLWLFSSIFVGLGAWLWKTWSVSRDAQAAQAAQAEKTRLEIAHRTLICISRMSAGQVATQQSSRVDALFDIIRETGMVSAPTRDLGGLPEFRARSVISLLSELARLEPRRRNDVATAIARWQVVVMFEPVLQSPPDNDGRRY